MYKQIAYIIIIVLIVPFSCVNDTEFEPISNACSSNLVANTSFAQVKELYQGELLQIQEDLIIEGYVISSDSAGNFFNVLHLQDSPINGTEGFQILIDLRESHLFFEVGSKLFIKLKGLYLDHRNGAFRLGGTFAAFGTTSVGRLPALILPKHLFLSCDDIVTIQPNTISIPMFNDEMVNTLIQINEIEFADEELGNIYALEREETERSLKDCMDNELVLLNSGFSDFQMEILPNENGSISGVLLKERDDFILVIRDLDDVDFTNERCEEAITMFTSTTVFISELADPNNNTGARFVELYNSANEALDLNGWSLRRYTNANTDVSSTIDLTGLIIAPQSTLVISPNAQEFEIVYGFSSDFSVSTNSPADSNGDDNLELIDPFGVVIDIFGVIGEDGSGTNHEFEDGRAFRNIEVVQANPNYNFSEWTIFNDTGEAGTINLPQNAPEDFSPGSRE